MSRIPGQDRHPTEPFVVMAKPAGPLCNLDCSYCYYLDTARQYERPHRFQMTDEVLETYVRNYIGASPGPEIAFVWHGGEPALAGVNFFRRAVALQRQYLPDGWTCVNNLQTNGTLLDDEWCSFLGEAGFEVGLSIDGTRLLHDTYRKDRSGSGSYERAAAAVRRLQANGVQPDILCTVTEELARQPVAVYRALRKLGTGWFQFIPIVRRDSGGKVTPDSVSPESYGRFLRTVFDQWAGHDLGRLNVQIIAEASLVWAGGTANVCQMAPTCGRVLVVEHDGSVYSCDHFVRPEHRIGDVETSTLDELVESKVQLRFGLDKRDGLPRQCRGCEWLVVCNGGCPKDRFAFTESGEPGLNYLCEGFRLFFAHARRPLLHAMERLRSGASREVVMAELRERALDRWRGVGRNDPCPCGSGAKAKRCCWELRP